MAYSIIEFKSKEYRFHDLDLSISCRLIIEMNDEHSFENLEEIFHKWLDSISFDAPGCLNLYLNEYLKNTDLKQSIEILINDVIESLNEYKNYYPKEKLNILMKKEKINFQNDYKIDLIYKTMNELKNLIQLQ